jgi:hypothetical protein
MPVYMGTPELAYLKACTPRRSYRLPRLQTSTDCVVFEAERRQNHSCRSGTCVLVGVRSFLRSYLGVSRHREDSANLLDVETPMTTRRQVERDASIASVFLDSGRCQP